MLFANCASHDFLCLWSHSERAREKDTFNWSHGDYKISWWSCSTWVMMWYLSMEQRHEIYERENWLEKVSFLIEMMYVFHWSETQRLEWHVWCKKRQVSIWPLTQRLMLLMLEHESMSFSDVKCNDMSNKQHYLCYLTMKPKAKTEWPVTDQFAVPLLRNKWVHSTRLRQLLSFGFTCHRGWSILRFHKLIYLRFSHWNFNCFLRFG